MAHTPSSLRYRNGALTSTIVGPRRDACGSVWAVRSDRIHPGRSGKLMGCRSLRRRLASYVRDIMGGLVFVRLYSFLDVKTQNNKN